MYFKLGAIAAALLLAGCSEETPKEITCATGTTKQDVYGIVQCVPNKDVKARPQASEPGVHQQAQATAGPEASPVPATRQAPLAPPATPAASKAPPASTAPADTPEVTQEAEPDAAPAEDILPTKAVDTPEADAESKAISFEEYLSNTSIHEMLDAYRRMESNEGNDFPVRLKEEDLYRVLVAELEKADFENVDEALIALDSEEPFPWEIEEDDGETVKEVKERLVERVVARGDSLLSILADEGINTRFYYNLSKSDQKRLRMFSVGDKLVIKEEEGTLYYLAREVSPLKTLILERVGEKYELNEEITDPDTRLKTYQFALTHSLYVNGTRAGLSDNIIANLQDIMGERVNFARDIRQGDAFTLVLSEPVFNDQVVGRPTITAAHIKRQGRKDLYAIRYENEAGVVRYYDKDGSSLQTGFIRQPTNVKRISSHFSPQRRHPVTGRVRPHLGTDFAAPTGTPIYAASDGRVTRAGWASGYGNVVYVDHGNGVETRYGHMSKIKTRRGRHVSRGDVIGLVGMTGTATGPHLHYEYRVNGKAKNAMHVDLPTANPIPKSEKAKFERVVSDILKHMSDTQLAQGGSESTSG